MDTKKNNMPPALPNVDQGDEEKNKVSKGSAVGAAVGVGIAAAAGGAAAGATVLSDAINPKHYDLDDDDDEELDEGGNEEGNEDDGYYDDDKDLENKERVTPEDRRRYDDDADDERRRVRRDPRDDDDARPGRPGRPGRRDDDRGDPRNPRVRDDDDGGDIDERTDTIIERDQIDVDVKQDEWTPVGWRTIADQNGNEVTGMLFEDGNGGYVLITEGEPGSGIYDVAMNPNTGDRMAIDEQFAFTRGDLEAIIDTEGGYIAPGSEDRIFADNDDIDQDIIVTDDGELVAQRDLPDNGEENIINGDDIAMNDDEDIIMEDDETGGVIGDDDIAMNDDIISDDDDIIMDDETGGVGGDEDIAMNDDIISDDDIIMDANTGSGNDQQYAMADEEEIVGDDELEQYLGDDAVAEVNEEPVEFVDNSQELVADNTTYIPEDTYDNSMEMDAEVYDDGMDMV